jgi:hypothetical protein
LIRVAASDIEECSSAGGAIAVHPGPLVAALSGPEQYIFGNLTICGSHIAPDSGETDLCGLIEAQQRLIAGVHAAMPEEEATP